MGTAHQAPVYFDMLSNITVNKKSENTVLLKSTGYEKSRTTVIADGQNFDPTLY